MADAMTVARYLIGRGFDPAEPDESVLLCPMRVQKMLYYAQGWSLAVLGRPLFRQPIEAWKHGPVVRDVYAAFAGRADGITPDRAGPPTESLAPAELRLLDMVWREYVRYTPSQLRRMTHAERPWVEARNGLPDDAPSAVPISRETMAAFFAEQAARAGKTCGGFDPADVWAADEAADRGDGVAADELFGELLGSGSAPAECLH